MSKIEVVLGFIVLGVSIGAILAVLALLGSLNAHSIVSGII